MLAKERAIVAGTEVAAEIFRRVDPDLRLEIVAKGRRGRSAGATVLEIRGRARSILTGERVALNFLQRLSGIATLTHQFVEAAGPGRRAAFSIPARPRPGCGNLKKQPSSPAAE